VQVKEIRVTKSKSLYGLWDYSVSELTCFGLIWSSFPETFTSEEEVNKFLETIPEPKLIDWIE
jgi:hypothetical protein